MKNNIRFSNWIWGTFMLLAAVFVLANQFGGFVDIGLGSIVAAALALAFIVQCVVSLSFAPLPIPLAVLYIIFQTPLGFPELRTWTLLLAALFATVGLSILLPRKYTNRGGSWGDRQPQMHTEDGGEDNNPSVSVKFGSVSRYLHSDCLESAQLYCNFGAVEVFFDKVQLSSKGAEAHINCSFGGMTIYVPKHWRVMDNINCTLGGVEVDNRFATTTPNAPVLTLSGNVLLGGVEVRFV